MYYDRQIRYLDYWEKGQRLRGGGYLKTEVRDGRLQMELAVNGLHATDSFGREVVLLGAGKEAAVGRVQLLQGVGKYRQQWNRTEDIGGTGIGYGEWRGIRIPIGPGREITCNWQARADREGEQGSLGKYRGISGKKAETMKYPALSSEEDKKKSQELRPEEQRAMAADNNVIEEGIVQEGRDAGREGNLGNTWKGGEAGDAERAERPENTWKGGEAGDTERAERPENAWKGGEAGDTERRGNSGKGEGPEETAKGERPENAWKGGEAGDTERRGNSGKGERPENAWKGEEAEDIKRREAHGGKGGMMEINGRARVPGTTGRREQQEENGGVQETGTKAVTDIRKTDMPEIEKTVSNVSGQGRRRDETSQKNLRQKPIKLQEEKWAQLWTVYPHIRPFHDNREYISIGPPDFVIFPESSYKMVNNSFLLHGYYNYRHLLLARVERKGEVRYYIGVPGNFYEREKQVAIMFGFESFECAEEPAQAGDFGYYMMQTGL